MGMFIQDSTPASTNPLVIHTEDEEGEEGRELKLVFV